jgi:hypothetical protein
MSGNFSEAVLLLDREQKRGFYQFFALDLTEAVRVTIQNEDLPEDEKLSRVRWLNEILNQTVARMRGLSWERQESVIPDYEQAVRTFVSKNPEIGWMVTYSLKRAYEIAVNEKSAGNP